jgi:tRNA (cytidine/uridine-2'-O-)-methyltransferase
LIHVVFVEPEIHWNTGNVGRTCLATGAQLHLVEPLGFKLGDKEVKRAGLDYWPRVAPRVWYDWKTFERELPALGTPYLLSPEGERDFWEVEYPENPVLLFGRESTGFSSELRQRYRDQLIRVPMVPDSVRSLNLSTCAALVLYEVLRQRRAR